MIKNLIEKYKNYKKQHYLNLPKSYKGKYAFVGVGNHSLNNLYPVLDFLAVPLKYICTKGLENSTKMSERYNAEGTNDLEKIVNDNEVKGVFICSNPKIHFELCKKFFLANKSIFVEKPPCASRAELDELISISKNSTCVVGLQKRYAVVNSILKQKIGKANSYNLRYLTGSFPEGNPILDLFIHPLDLAIFLFGKVKNVETKSVGTKQNKTIFAILEHSNGTLGNLELSTDYSWAEAKETLVVNTEKGVFETKGTRMLTFVPKSLNILGIPLEKVVKLPRKREILYEQSDFVPIGEFNSIHVNGYFDEIKTFTDLVEGQNKTNFSTLKDLRPTYELIEKIKI